MFVLGCNPQQLQVVEQPECASSQVSCGGASGTDSSAQGGAGEGSAFLPTLLHRYDFEGEGSVVSDRIGTAHGTLVGTELSHIEGKGAAVLSGRDSGQYVELPSGIISELTSATFEAWVTWNGQSVWERILDFGDAVMAEEGQLIGSTYLFMTPRTPLELGGVARVTQRQLAQPELVVDTPEPLPVGRRTHVALVIDETRDVLQLFINAELVVSQAILDHSGSSFNALSTLNDQGNWLGRSHFDQDAFFGGSFHEFRIYGSALSARQIATSYEAGPDPTP